jgi:hypothetical protein
MSDTSASNVPMDVVAENAEAVVKAAIAWRWSQAKEPVLTVAEWRLYEATGNYGSDYKGLRAQ